MELTDIYYIMQVLKYYSIRANMIRFWGNSRKISSCKNLEELNKTKQIKPHKLFNIINTI